MEGSENIFLVILYNSIATVYSTCPSSNKNCCLPGFYWNKDLNICTGCKIGFFGQNCASPCRYPNYGERCQEKCNCTQNFCDTTKGCRNSSDCNFGYYGRTCLDPCRFPNYGERCQSWCNCTETACNHITGCQLGTGQFSDSESSGGKDLSSPKGEESIVFRLFENH
ncbi:scavenger receptor class F member 1-like [Saccostrea echinata]|uniref:scavenger receptor class F member 1-like n=1 Tax=Saccostrea echinata TaxID=191078 RepID=UPI002A837D58|nr:scavenger receptor class F member 1-like [Saccostrea echinata]